MDWTILVFIAIFVKFQQSFSFNSWKIQSLSITRPPFFFLVLLYVKWNITSKPMGSWSYPLNQSSDSPAKTHPIKNISQDSFQFYTQSSTKSSWYNSILICICPNSHAISFRREYLPSKMYSVLPSSKYSQLGSFTHQLKLLWRKKNTDQRFKRSDKPLPQLLKKSDALNQQKRQALKVPQMRVTTVAVLCLKNAWSILEVCLQTKAVLSLICHLIIWKDNVEVLRRIFWCNPQSRGNKRKQEIFPRRMWSLPEKMWKKPSTQTIILKRIRWIPILFHQI